MGARQSGEHLERASSSAVKSNVAKVVVRCKRNGPCSLSRSATHFDDAFPLELHGKVDESEWDAFIRNASQIAAQYPIKYLISYIFALQVSLIVAGAMCQNTAGKKEKRNEDASTLRTIEVICFVSFAVLLLYIAYLFYSNVYEKIPRANKALRDLVAETSERWQLHAIEASCVGFSWTSRSASSYVASSPYYTFTSTRIFSDNPPHVVFYVSLIEAEEIAAPDSMDSGDILLAVAAQ